ncbi:acetylserotonin O-methyltransferase-like [Ranitomeya imitator]|uniref:acetylserotonin O-methyltransferase-like n=1 Tax=Ranitomeya imitator TaxID=111125 RepID=UPI0037E7D799
MCSSKELEYPQKLIDYAYGFLVSKTVFTACELGVFDCLHEAQEPVSAGTIASRLSTTVDGMERLLDACVGLKLLGCVSTFRMAGEKQFLAILCLYCLNFLCLQCLFLFIIGDFFNDPIPEADLFIMARIINDWTEEKCLALLRKMYQSCRPGGGVLLVEVLLNEDKSGPVSSQLFSLNMLVQTEGRERTPSEYTKLLTDSGFRDIKVKATGKLYDAILGRKLI